VLVIVVVVVAAAVSCFDFSHPGHDLSLRKLTEVE